MSSPYRGSIALDTALHWLSAQNTGKNMGNRPSRGPFREAMLPSQAEVSMNQRLPRIAILVVMLLSMLVLFQMGGSGTPVHRVLAQSCGPWVPFEQAEEKPRIPRTPSGEAYQVISPNRLDVLVRRSDSISGRERPRSSCPEGTTLRSSRVPAHSSGSSVDRLYSPFAAARTWRSRMSDRVRSMCWGLARMS